MRRPVDVDVDLDRRALRRTGPRARSTRRRRPPPRRSLSPETRTLTFPPQRPSGDVSTVVSTRRAPGGTTNGAGSASSVPSTRDTISQRGARATTSVTVEPRGTRAPGAGRTASSAPGSDVVLGRSSTTGVKPASTQRLRGGAHVEAPERGHRALRRAGRDDELHAGRALDARARRRIGLERMPGLDLASTVRSSGTA